MLQLGNIVIIFFLGQHYPAYPREGAGQILTIVSSKHMRGEARSLPHLPRAVTTRGPTLPKGYQRYSVPTYTGVI